MHRVWVSSTIEYVGRDEHHPLANLLAMDMDEARGKAQAGAVEDWATEKPAGDPRQAYRDPATGQRINPVTKLADDYQTWSLPLAKRRLYQAGVRLAMVLNEVFLGDR